MRDRSTEGMNLFKRGLRRIKREEAMYRLCNECGAVSDQPQRTLCSQCEHELLSEIAERNGLNLDEAEDE